MESIFRMDLQTRQTVSMLASTTVKTSYFKALGDERKDVKFSLQEQREQIWQIALKKKSSTYRSTRTSNRITNAGEESTM